MKNIFYLIVLVVITNRDIKSQEINPIDFFPHHVGDLWQYFNHTQAGSEFWEKRITAIDTVETDTSIIITMNYRNSYDILHKIYFNDSLIVYWKPIGSEDYAPRYKFDVPINTFWYSNPYSQWYTKYVIESEELIFDDTLLYREYWTAPDTSFVLSLFNERLALGIGEYYGEFEVGFTVLNGCIINGVQYGTIVNVEDQNEITHPSDYILNNFPNPFNGQTTIHYYIPTSKFIALNIYDILGNEIERLYGGEERAGHHYKIWNPKAASSGLYFVVMRTSDLVKSKKMLYLK